MRELVTVIEGKIHSETACRIVALLLGQLLEMDHDVGTDADSPPNPYVRNYLRTTKISPKGTKTQFQKVDI